MKKLVGVIAISSLVFGCGKNNEYTTNFASALFINAVPSNTSPSIANVQVFVDTMVKSASAVAYGGNSGYLGIQPGSRKLEIKRTDSLRQVYAASASESFTGNTASTFVLYDTLASRTGTMRWFRLSDNLTLPATGNVHVRFLHLAPNAPAVDITLLRPNTLPTLPDSVTLSNRSYVGPSPSAAAITTLSTFSPIPLGAYTIRVKLAGTQTVVLSVAASLTAVSGIYTIFATGTAQGRPLTAGLVRHYP